MANTYTNAKLDLSSTSATTLYTCATATTAIFKSILVSEDSGNADTITVTLTNGTSVFSLFKTKSISANAEGQRIRGQYAIVDLTLPTANQSTAQELFAANLHLSKSELSNK